MIHRLADQRKAVTSVHLYPVKTTTDDGRTLRNLRLRASESGTVVWQLDRESGEVAELVRVEDQPERVGATQKFRVAELVFEPQRGCGCNHPMYTWVPPEE